MKNLTNLREQTEINNLANQWSHYLKVDEEIKIKLDRDNIILHIDGHGLKKVPDQKRIDCWDCRKKLTFGANVNSK